MDNNRIIREILMNIMMERIMERVKVSQMKATKITSRKVKNQVIMERLKLKAIKMTQMQENKCPLPYKIASHPCDTQNCKHNWGQQKSR